MKRWVLLLGLLFSAFRVSAQTTYPPILFLPDEDGRTTAVAIRFPVGSAQDPPGEEGSAYLLGRLLQEVGNTRLLASGGELLVEVGPEEFLLTLLSPPDRWRENVAVVESLLFGGVLPESEFDEVQGEVLDILSFEIGSPVRDFEVARAELIRGTGSLAARPTMGSIATVSALTEEALSAFRLRHLRRETGVVAVAGPIATQEAEEVFGRIGQQLIAGGVQILPPLSVDTLGDSLPLPSSENADTLTLRSPQLAPQPSAEITPLRVPGSSSSPPAWLTGERIEVNRELTSTWIAAAYPLPVGSPSLLLGFLSHLVEEALNPSPPDPGLFQVESTVHWLDARPILVISASVDPREAGRWEERILGILPALAISPPTGSFFELARRRFRSSLLLELAAPENRVRWAVREESHSGTLSRSIEDSLWRLDQEGVAGAAAATLPPRVYLVGPLGMRAP